MDPRDYLIRILVKAISQVNEGFDKAAQAGDKFRADELRKEKKQTGDVDTELRERQRIAKGFEEERTRVAKKHADDREKVEQLTTKSMIQDARRLSGEMKRLGRDVDHALREPDGGSRLSNFLDTLRDKANNNHESIAKLDNQLRGLATLGVIIFAQQLLTVVTALGGAFIAVASSAAMAGGAIGGAFAAAAAQSIPVIGLLVAAFGRIGAVFKAFEQSNKASAAAGNTHTQSMERQRNAANRVREAQEALTEAQKRAREAQGGLNKARQEARRELEDLIAAERSARLEAEGAILAQDQAQRRFRQTMSSGDIEGFQQAQLDVESAGEQNLSARRNLQRASQDATTGRRQGIEGSDTVRSARREIEQAENAVSRARRSLKEARLDAKAAGAATAGAARQLNQLLAQLTPAERKLYTALRRMQTEFRATFRPITDIVVRGFTGAVNRVTGVLDDPRITRGFKGIAGEVSNSIGSITKTLTSDRSLNMFSFFMAEAKKNLPDLTKIASSFFNIFLNLAKAASPALRMIVGWIRDWAAGMEKVTGSREGQRSLRDFFIEGAKHLRSWVHLLGSIINLFLALAGAGGAREGKRGIDDLAESIDKAAENVRKNKNEVGRFFKDSREVMGQIGKVLIDIGKLMIDAFHSDNIKPFTDLLREVLLPALGITIAVFGALTTQVAKFLTLPGIKQITQLAISLSLVSIAATRLGGALSFILKPIGAIFKFFAEKALFGRFAGSISEAVGALSRFKAVFGPIGLLITVAVGYFTSMIKNFGLLKTAIISIFGPIGLIIGFISLLARRLGITKDLPGDIAHAFRSMARAIGNAAGDVKDFIVKAFNSVIRFLRDLPGDFLNLARRMGSFLVRGFAGIGGRVVSTLRGAFDAVWTFLRRLPGRFADFAKDAATSFVDGFKNVGERVIKGIIRGMKDLGGFGKDIANAFIDLINTALPNKIPIPGLKDIPLPKNPFPKLAGGGFIGNQGERGADKEGTWLGRGEAVLNWAHQKIVEPAMQAYHGFGLGDMFKRVRGEHAGGGQVGMAGGGWKQGARTPSGPAAGPINQLARWLFGKGFSATSGGEYRGTGTHHDRQQAADWGSSVNNLRSLWRAVFPYRDRIQELYGPSSFAGLYERGKKFFNQKLQADHEDHIHTAVVSSIRGLGGAASPRRGSQDIDAPASTSRRVNVMANLFRQLPRSLQGDWFTRTFGRDPSRRLSNSPFGQLAGDVFGTARNFSTALSQDLAARIKIGTRTVSSDDPTDTGGKGLDAPVGRALAKLNKRFPAHSLSNARGKFQMTVGQVRAVARSQGFPTRDAVIMDRISAGESTRYPGIISWDKGYGLLQMTPRVWGAAAKAFMNSLGGINEMLNPFKNLRMAKYLYDGRKKAGNFRFGDWMSSSRTWLQPGMRFGGFFDKGGEILGKLGEAVPILAHAGEMVLTKGQQMALGGTNYLKSKFGFGGEPKSAFQTGGQVTEWRRLTPRVQGMLDPLDSIINTFTGINRTVRRAVGALPKARRLDLAISRLFTNVLGDGGLFDQLTANLESMRTRFRRSINTGTFNVRGSGQVLGRRLSGEQGADREFSQLQNEYRFMLSERALFPGLLRDARKSLALAKRKKDPKAIKAADTVIKGLLQKREALEDSIGEAALSLGEAAEARLQAAVERVNNVASRQQAWQGYGSRLADLRERAGDAAGAFSMRGSILQQQGSTLRTQAAGIRDLFMQAMAANNTPLAEQLYDQLGDLNTQIEENTAAQKENTIATRQSAIDRIIGRGGFLTGVFGNLSSLLTGVAGATGGAVDISRQKTLVGQVIEVLGGTGSALRQKLFEGFGLDLRGLDPFALTDSLRSLNFDQIESGLSESQRQQFEGLINSIIENATAVQQNTQQLKELNGSDTQGWSSTAWQWFRNAIFNGSGGLLPQYRTGIPSMDIGGEILSNGLIFAHSGERVIAANVNRGGASSGTFAPNFNITEQVEDADPDVLANRMMWAYNTRSK